MGEQVLHEVAADKSTCAADDCFLSFEFHSGGGLLFKGLRGLERLHYLKLSGASVRAMVYSSFQFRWGRGNFQSNAFGVEDVVSRGPLIAGVSERALRYVFDSGWRMIWGVSVGEAAMVPFTMQETYARGG
jgi:hypothetical protein